MGRLFWKILLGLWLTLVVTGVGVGLAVHLYSQARLAQMTQLAAGRGAEFAVSAVAALLDRGGPAAVEPLFRDWPRDRPQVLIVDAAGHDLLGRPVPPAALARAREELGGAARAPGVRRVRAPDGRAYILFVPVPQGRLARRLRAHHVLPPAYFFGLRLGALLLASLLFSGALAWYLTRPLRRLREASQRLADGALETRVSAAMGRRRDEIADLGRDFDHMAARLQALVGAQRRLLHDVSHELRSPLARLQVAVGLARQRPETTAKALERIEHETRRLDELVGEVLTLSRLEAGFREPIEEYLDLADLLAAVVEDARFEAAPSDRRVELQVEGAMLVNGRAELLRRALDNVIRNALRYTPAGTAVEVTAAHAAGGEWLHVRICDRGPGVPPAALEAMFDPFFRGEDRVQRNGYGLGLAIAKRAVEAHAGTIRATNRPGGGLCIDIALRPAGELPAEDDEPAAKEG